MGKLSFGSALQELITTAGVKNLNIASATQYDVSYISKWISGKALPSEKNASVVIDAIAASVCMTADEDHLNRLEQKYSSAEGLCSGISRYLMDAYESSRGRSKERSQQEYHAVLPVCTIIERLWDSLGEISEPIRMFAAIDLFRIDHKSRVLLSGIEDGRFRDLSGYQDAKVALITCMQEPFSDETCVYDAISLIHLMTGLSGLQMTIYNNPAVRNALMIAVRNGLTASGTLLAEDHTCYGASLTTDPRVSEQLCERMQVLCGEQQLLFRKTTMMELLTNYEYAQSVMAPQPCWVMGHMTEHLLPNDIFQEIAALNPLPQMEMAPVRQAHELTRAMLRGEDAQLLIYDSAVTHFLLTGEMDFFNTPVQLTKEQRLRCLQYLKELMQSGVEIRLILGGFSTDFQNISNPCLFLTEDICYLRLENGRYEDNLLVVNDRTAVLFFQRFFRVAWEKRSDVVVKCAGEVAGKLDRFIQTTLTLLENEG